MQFVFSFSSRFKPYALIQSIMFGGPGGDDHEANKRMADLQVKSSFIQFFIAVGLINLAPYALEALMGESVR
ncbi:unnamed protein product [Adineta ricciae]|uniref:Uncharacterized protein n=1 Tax=Adineta ricciae TaxID=249248 RepID=A0A814GLD0_ADIRI|nr:unnamed protein product [Adineta ricciae]